MDLLLGTIFFFSLLSLIIFLVLLIIKLIFKKGMKKRRIFIAMGSAVVLMILSLLFAPEMTGEQKAQRAAKQEEKDEAAAKKQAEKDQEKKEAGKKKAEKEAGDRKKEKEEEESKAVDAKRKKEKEEKATKKEKKKQEAVEKKKEPKKKEKDDINLKNAKDASDFTRILKEKDNHIDKVLLEQDIAIVIYSAHSSWSETSVFEEFARDSASIMKELKDNTNIDGIGFARMGELTDKKGNESNERIMIAYFDQENYKEINFSNFPSALYVDASNFYEISDGYWMHPSIYMNVKDNALNGLPFVPAETSEGFETVSNASQ